jgi:histone H3/H4
MARTKHIFRMTTRGKPSNKIQSINQYSLYSQNLQRKTIEHQPVPEIKKKRFKLETVPLRDIRKYQNKTELSKVKNEIQHVIRIVSLNVESYQRISSNTLDCLQKVTEKFLNILFHETEPILQLKDTQIAQKIRGERRR